jgi:NAD(P)-dependent dehydrogenase (short-subunit alcohol dehydrogenase family)
MPYRPLSLIEIGFTLYLSAYDWFRNIFMALLHWCLPSIVPKYVPWDPVKENAILITGTSTGIGADAALYFAHAGFTIYAGVRKADDGHRLVRMYQESRGPQKGQIKPLILDVALPRAIRQAVRTVQKDTTCQLVGVINNAGVCPAFPVEMIPSNTLVNLMKVNILGCMNVTTAFLPLLRQTPGSRIVIVGSANGSVAMPIVGAYSASKFAVEGWTDALRLELLDQGISVSLIKPGSIKTPIFEKSRTEFEQVTSSASLDLDDNSSNISAPMDSQEDLRPVYDKWLKLAPLVSESLVGRAISPYYCSLALWHAITSPYPQTKYFVSWDSVVLCSLRPWIPDRLWDAAFLALVRINVQLFGKRGKALKHE